MKQNQRYQKRINIQLNELFIRRFGNLLTIINNGHSSTVDNCDLHLISKGYSTAINSRIESRGNAEAVTFFKKVHHIATCVALRRPFIPLSFVISDKIGRPKVLKPLIPLLLSSNPDDKRMGLTITKLYMSIMLKPNLDVESITMDSKSKPLGRRGTKFLSFWTRKFRKPNLAGDRRGHATTKMGPNGPALVTCHIDIKCLLRDKTVASTLSKGISKTDPSLYKCIQQFLPNGMQNPQGGDHHSKLILLSESGGKTRPVAIADYFTQESLRSLFRETMDYLKQLKTDGTYNQGNLVSKMKQAIQEGKPIYCYDLKNATDRFPVDLQRDFLAPLIGQDRADLGKALLTERSFKMNDQYVEYKVGQPMGILSSWSVFALTHHAIIEYCAYLEKLSNFRDYVVLGDDVAIFNSKVAKRYLKLLDNQGVPISLEKSFVGEPGSNFPPSGEIAKRLVLEGEEITPLPFDLLKTFIEQPLTTVLELRIKMEQIGVEFSGLAGETLSSVCPKRHRKNFNIIASTPAELLGPTIGLSASLGEGGIASWAGIDLTLFHRLLCKVLIKDLTDKMKKIPELIQVVLGGCESITNPIPGRKTFKKLQGSPISLSDLGYGCSSDEELHPLVQVMNSKLVDLQTASNAIKAALVSEENLNIKGDMVYHLDFNLNETFMPRKRKVIRGRTKLILKTGKIFHQSFIKDKVYSDDEINQILESVK